MMRVLKDVTAILLILAFVVAYPVIFVCVWAKWLYRRIDLWAVYDGDADEQAKDG
jgi:hypothetical protein